MNKKTLEKLGLCKTTTKGKTYKHKFTPIFKKGVKKSKFAKSMEKIDKEIMKMNVPKLKLSKQASKLSKEDKNSLSTVIVLSKSPKKIYVVIEYTKGIKVQIPLKSIDLSIIKDIAKY